MTVLRNAACKKNREWYNSCSKKCHENYMWTRFRNDTYQSCQKNHQSGVVTYPGLYIHVLQTDADNEQNPESPDEDSRQMFLDDVAPDMFFYKMIGTKQHDKQHDDTQSSKKHIHPVFAEQIDVGFFMTTVAVVLSRNMLMRVSVRGMVMAQLAACQCSNEQCKADKHDDTLPPEMSFDRLIAMDRVALVARCLYATIPMVMQAA